MAKLERALETAGMNSDATVLAKMVRPETLIVDWELNSFKINETLLDEIAESMKLRGYDIAEVPVVERSR